MKNRYESKTQNNFENLNEKVRLELLQEEYNIKFNIYSLTRNLDVMSMSLDNALLYKNCEDSKYKSYKQQKYDKNTGFPKDYTEINYVNLLFEFECLAKENRISEVLEYIDKLDSFYTVDIVYFISYNYYLQKLHNKPCNLNLTKLIASLVTFHTQ